MRKVLVCIAMVVFFSSASATPIFAQDTGSGSADSSTVKKATSSPPKAVRKKGPQGSGSPNWNGPTPSFDNSVPGGQMEFVGGPNVDRKVDGAFVPGGATVIGYRTDEGEEGEVLSFAGGPEKVRGPVIIVDRRPARVTYTK